MKHLLLFVATICVTINCSANIISEQNQDKETSDPIEYQYESAMWLWSSHTTDEAITLLAANGIQNAIVNEYVFTSKGEAETIKWIDKATEKGIKVHIWIQCFYSNSSWINPVKDGKIDKVLFDSIIEKAIKYANISNVAGVHLDYLRYPGTAYKTEGGPEAVSEFARQLSEQVKKVNPKIILSAAIMPETTSDLYYYGQDIPTLGKYLDVLCPMVYKGNYKKDTEWITTTAKWFLDNSGKADVWVGLQTYYSDDSTTPLSYQEMQNDIKAALKAGNVGVAFFRYGLFKWFTVHKF